MWDVAGRQLIRSRLSIDSWVPFISPDGSLAYVQSPDRTSWVFLDMATRQVVHEPQPLPEGWAWHYGYPFQPGRQPFEPLVPTLWKPRLTLQQQ